MELDYQWPYHCRSSGVPPMQNSRSRSLPQDSVFSAGLAPASTFQRRSFLAAAAGAAAAIGLGEVFGREYGPNAPPVRYPDPDIVALDKKFEPYKLGNTPIQRLHHSQNMLWAE